MCLCYDQSEVMMQFMVFNLWTGPGLIFEPCTEFLFFQ